jgi:hypothetical protein
MLLLHHVIVPADWFTTNGFAGELYEWKVIPLYVSLAAFEELQMFVIPLHSALLKSVEYRTVGPAGASLTVTVQTADATLWVPVALLFVATQ